MFKRSKTTSVLVNDQKILNNLDCPYGLYLSIGLAKLGAVASFLEYFAACQEAGKG